jgi:hypothetical protein
MKEPGDDYFLHLDREIELLAAGAASLDRRDIVDRLEELKLKTGRLGTWVAKNNISQNEAETAFKSELRDFIEFLNGRLDSPLDEP